MQKSVLPVFPFPNLLAVKTKKDRDVCDTFDLAGDVPLVSSCRLSLII